MPPIADGRYPQGPDEVALGAATADGLGARVGDRLTIETMDGGQPVSLTVSGTVVEWDSADPEHAFVVPPDTLRTLLCPDVSLAECNVTANVFASASDDAARAAMAEAGFHDVVAPANVLRLGQVGPIPWLLAGFLCVFAAAGVLHGRAHVAAPPLARPGDRPGPRARPAPGRRRADLAGRVHGGRRERGRRAARSDRRAGHLADHRHRPRRRRRPPVPASWSRSVSRSGRSSRRPRSRCGPAGGPATCPPPRPCGRSEGSVMGRARHGCGPGPTSAGAGRRRSCLRCSSLCPSGRPWRSPPALDERATRSTTS